MNDMLRPTGLVAVGAIFICLSLAANALGSVADLPDLQKEMKKSLSGTLDQSQGSTMGKFRVHGDTITFPWSEQYKSGSGPFMPTSPSKERITLNETDPDSVVYDLTAINGIRERDIIYDGSQDGDPGSQGLSNSLEISVTGQEADDGSISWNGGNSALDIESVVDEALSKDGKTNPDGKNVTGIRSAPTLGNNMIIDVSGISVSAINSVKGGSATATSNIIIRPVQIIVCPSEVEEKLK